MLQMYQRGWTVTLAGSNENLKLELPRAWEPLDRSNPSKNYEGASSHSMFLDGD